MTTIICDTRQKVDKHELKHNYFEEHGYTIIRSKLAFGDYAFPPTASIDTKQDIQEIASNMCGSMKERSRFREECKLARDAGSKLIILIEDNTYSSIDDLYETTIRLRSGWTIKGDQLANAMIVMHERYGVDFMFCDPADSGRIIIELLEKYDGQSKTDK